MNQIKQAKKSLLRNSGLAIPERTEEMVDFMNTVPSEYVRKEGKIQACDHYETWEGNRLCSFYFAGMCNCPESKDCPYGNENRIWLQDGEEAEAHSKKCKKIFKVEEASWHK